MIDIHNHYDRANPRFADWMVERMDRDGVEKTVILAIELPSFGGSVGDPSHFGGNEDVLRAVRQHPDRLLGGVYLDPREAGARDTLHRYVEHGFRMAKMFPPVGFCCDQPEFLPLFEEMARCEIPVLVHCGVTSFAPYSKCARPIYLDTVARLVPELNIIVAHLGHPWFLEAAGLSAFNGNVYLDLSGSAPKGRGTLKHSGYPVAWQRMVWGSDNMRAESLKSHVGLWQDFLDEVNAGEHRDAIFHQNARNLLRL